MENEQYEPLIIYVTSAIELQISKQDAKSFHSQMRERILSTGKGLFEYMETLKFFEKVLKVLTGDSSATKQEEKEGDKELKDYIRSEITKYGKTYVSPRGTKFELAETGTKYHFDKTGDPILAELYIRLQTAQLEVKEREEFLKGVPTVGMDILLDGGEVVKIFPPYKTSTSSYKVTLPK